MAGSKTETPLSSPPSADFFKLSTEVQAVLAEALDADSMEGVGLDAIAFRAKHHRHLAVLASQEDRALLIRRQDIYVVSLIALRRVEHLGATAILDAAERLYAELRRSYIADPRRPVVIADLASVVGLQPVEVLRTIQYMQENPTWSAGHSNPMSSPDATLTVAEGVLSYENFACLVDQLEHWRVQRGQFSWRAPEPFSANVPGAHEASPQFAKWAGAWQASLPPAILAVMQEVYAAKEHGLSALPAMGIRAALDLLMTHLLGKDDGTFDQKLNELVKLGFLTEGERRQVLATIDAGSASAHRGHVPAGEDLDAMLTTCEVHLKRVFFLSAAAERLRTNTPRRSNSKAKRP